MNQQLARTRSRSSGSTPRSHSLARMVAEVLERRVLLSAAAPVLNAWAVSDHQANLAWSSSSAATGEATLVQRSDAGGPFATVATLPSDATSFDDTSLSPVTPYQYRLGASDGSGGLVYSNTAPVESLPSRLTTILPPLPPQLVETSSFPRQIVPSGSFAGFWATDSSGAAHLWRTDGTSAGTMLVSPTVSLSTGSIPPQTVSMGGSLYFMIGNQLYRSDGTAAGTAPIATLYSGYTCVPQGLAVVGNELYLLINSSGGSGLWKTDGTSAGTMLVRQQNDPFDPVVAGGKLYFLDSGLWVTDGTAAGTVRLAAQPPRAQIFGSDGKLFFSAAPVPGTSATTLWATDGTAAGTVQVAQDQSLFGSFGFNAVSMGSDLYFIAFAERAHPVQLWKSDGTASGTGPVLDLTATGGGTNLFAGNGTLYFQSPSADGAATNLWATDGSAAPVLLGTMAGQPPTLLSHSSAAGVTFLSGADSAGHPALWVTDGTPAGTRVVKTFINQPLAITAFQGRCLFDGDDTHGEEPWVSDGTPAGTQMLKDIAYTLDPLLPTMLAPGDDGSVYFTARGSTGQAGIYLQKADGSAPALVSSGRGVTGMLSEHGTLFLSVEQNDSAGNLFTDVDALQNGTSTTLLTASGTDPLSGIGSLGSREFLNIGGGLVATDGTAAGTAGLARTSGPYAFSGSFLYFIGAVPVTQTQVNYSLERTDGTTAGTTKLMDLRDDGAGYQIAAVSDGSVVLAPPTATDPILRVAPDGSTTPIGASGATSLMTFQGKAYFLTTQGLWVSDGTPAGTALVTPLPATVNESIAPAASPVMYFASGGNLYRSDGTGGGTYLIGAGVVSAVVGQTSNAIFFINGQSLWVSDGTPTGTRQIDATSGDIPQTALSGNQLFYIPQMTGGPTLPLRMASLDVPADPVGVTLSRTFASGGGQRASVQLSWVPADANASGFIVERSTDSSFATIDAAYFTGAAVPDVVDWDPTGAPLYYYRVRAVSAGGSSVPLSASSANFAVIQGTVFNDANHNGTRDSGEAGLAGWTVYFDSNGNGKPDPGELQTTTDAGGNWAFGGLSALDRTLGILREVRPSGWASTAVISHPGSLQFGQVAAGPDFGNVLLADVPMDFNYLLTLAQHYGFGGTFAQGDVNGDGVVNFADLLLVAQNYGHPLRAGSLARVRAR